MDTPAKAPVLTPHSVLLSVLRRNAPGREKGSVSVCSVCGKEHSRNDKRVNEKCPTHKRAYEGKYNERLALLEKALKSDLIDFAQRGQFNAEVQVISNDLYIARKEHDAYVPEEKPADPKGKAPATVKIDEPAVCAGLREILHMVGGKADAERDPMKLITYIKGNLALVLKK